MAHILVNWHQDILPQALELLGDEGCGRAIWDMELGANVALAIRNCVCYLLGDGF